MSEKGPLDCLVEELATVLQAPGTTDEKSAREYARRILEEARAIGRCEGPVDRGTGTPHVGGVLTSYIDPLTAKCDPESDEDVKRLRAKFLVLYQGPVPPPEIHVDFGAGGKKVPADAFVPLPVRVVERYDIAEPPGGFKAIQTEEPPPDSKVNFREFL